MVDLSLLWISALFYVALTSLIYLVSVGIVWVLSRLGRNKRVAPPQSRRKRLVLAALVLPPLLSIVPTVAGTMLSHLHSGTMDSSMAVMDMAPYKAFRTEPLTPLAHHAMACQQLFHRLALLGGLGAAGNVGQAVSIGIGATTWLLLVIGFISTIRLVWATLRLEAGLSPLLAPPSPRLVASLARMKALMPSLPTRRFFECPLPAAFSSVLGLSRVRCVLSERFVADAPDEEIDAVVAHEAGHLHGGDVYATFLVGVLKCVFFFLMPVRLLGKWWREAAELASDDAAVRATRNPLAMASAILRISSIPGTTHLGGLPAIALPFADETACSPAKRVERLLDQAEQATLLPRTETPLQIAAAWATTGIFACVGAGLLLSSEASCVAHCALALVQKLL